MWAVVVRESGDQEQIEAIGEHLAANVAPRLRSAPGFVSALWTSDGHGGTLNVIVFETEAAASAAPERIGAAPRPPFMQFESAVVVRVLANA